MRKRNIERWKLPLHCTGPFSSAPSPLATHIAVAVEESKAGGNEFRRGLVRSPGRAGPQT